MIKIIKGKAGTGKTEYIKNLINSDHETIYVVCCPTNKAVTVLKKRGITAHTIHSAMFMPTGTGEFKTVQIVVLNQKTNRPLIDSNGCIVYHEKQEEIVKFKFNEEALYHKIKIGRDVDLANVTLIIDESSMIGAGMWRDLLTKFSGNIVAVGDDRQLKPMENDIKLLEKEIAIKKKNKENYQDEDYELKELLCYKEYFSKAKADITLTTQHRQQKGSGILTIADVVCNGGKPPYGMIDKTTGVECLDLDKHNIDVDTPGFIGRLLEADIVIVNRNESCRILNSRIRSFKFKEEFNNLTEDKQRIPRIHDKLYVESNYIDIENSIALIKGEILTITNITHTDWLTGIMYIDGYSDAEQTFRNIPLGLYFVGAEKRNKIKHLTCCYGYVLTCHKCQGSQWDEVVVIDECNFGCDAHWYYTAITRASKFVYVFKYADIKQLFGVQK